MPDAIASPDPARPPPSPQPPPATRSRLWEFDALRGLMLLLMTLTHLPTRFADATGQPLGFVSAAEGFVMLSAFMAGMVYTKREQQEGGELMAKAFWQRAFKIYLVQAALLAFLFSVVALIAVFRHEPAARGLMEFYLENPGTAIVNALLLIYSPPLLDILPMYVIFMVLSPMLLVHGRHYGWTGILALSLVVWFAAQFNIGRAFYDVIALVFGLKVPFPATGAFEMLGWQFLWVLGLWLGARYADGADEPGLAFPRWMIGLALLIFGVCLVWRHAIGQTPFPGEDGLNLMFDKWHLGPLRLLNFMALLVLAMHCGTRWGDRLPRLRPLEVLGTASLPVFCTHLVCALLALALVGAPQPGQPWSLDIAVVLLSFGLMYAVALASNALDRRSARRRQQRRQQGLRQKQAELERELQPTRPADPDPDPRVSAPSPSKSPRVGA